MNGGNADPAVFCPFYQYTCGKTICCEGHITGTTIIQGFTTTANRKAYMQEYCKSQQDHKMCEYAKLNYWKHEDEQGKKAV